MPPLRLAAPTLLLGPTGTVRDLVGAVLSLRLVYERQIEFVLVDRVPHLAEDVVERYRSEHQRAS